MKCPKAPFGDTKVIESRLVANGQAIRRRRECLDAPSHRFTTYERIERPHLIVVKRSGDRQMFDRNKILTGLMRATEKTSVSATQLEDMVAQIEESLYDRGDSEVRTEEIGEMVMNELAKVSDVAYVRFASVYRSFTDIASFEDELNRMKKRLYKRE
jgi:transcriptional repressor NrdR